MDQKKNTRIAYGELLNRCWEDAGYLEHFRSCPADALAEFGIDTVAGANYHVVDQSMEQLYIVAAEETTEDRISTVAEQWKNKIEEQIGEPFTGKIEVLRNTKDNIYLVYQPKPEKFELTDEMLTGVVGGDSIAVSQNVLVSINSTIVYNTTVAIEVFII